jgi:hypothetical protein
VPPGLYPTAAALRASGEAEGKAGSIFGLVAGEVAPVLLGDAAGDGEAEAVTGFAGVESNEALEYPLALVFGYARSIIGDERLGIAITSS